MNPRVCDVSQVDWQDEYDVVVIGAGAGGFCAATGAAIGGSSVALLEKASQPGGTFAKAPAGYWIPDNAGMRADGVREDDARGLRPNGAAGRSGARVFFFS